MTIALAIAVAIAVAMAARAAPQVLPVAHCTTVALPHKQGNLCSSLASFPVAHAQVFPRSQAREHFL